MRILLLVSLLISASAFAQLGQTGGGDSIANETTYYELGANYSFLRQENFWEGGNFFDGRDNLIWTGFDEDEEPIDEIIVIGTRTQLGAYLELSAGFVFGDMFTKTCNGYTDGGHCNSYETTVNTENWPLANQCQTVSGTMGPITGQQANGLNLEHQQNGAAITGAVTIGASLGAAALTAGQSVWLQYTVSSVVALGAMSATFPGMGDFPFTEGDTITYTMTGCNDGQGGMNVDISMTIG